MASDSDHDDGAGDAGVGEPSALGRALLRYVEARQASLTQARQELGVNELDARALLFIASHPRARPTSLRQYLGITSAGVTALVDRLEQRGAVRREVDPHDRRVNRLTVTVDLSAEPWSSLTRFDAAFERALAASGAGEAERLATLLEALIDEATG
ncbi:MULTISPECIES: MarR family winged helix-turn-helix transcriptional regulator [Microbacterium]|uniref:MarR family transcriptional regulator n=1 Tax=Microbacterium wangchenii TaxID=2541726 RepID=A0ABX5SSK9_9MICO|nr:MULTISPECIES: MarR family transcriptional regulator [Microbacterium]MCK6068002.1 MarR family transcriptional regulator [Microbacterium sp. EYE_512]QBR87859.1 MarR family transcriptional regulator [Microbacterium wangchenii]TXK16153.1 MarR family transcriptional regulator [Microbacterium wangchenii]